MALAELVTQIEKVMTNMGLARADLPDIDRALHYSICLEASDHMLRA